MSGPIMTFEYEPTPMDICRACLVSNELLIPLNDKFITNYNSLTNLNVSIDDSLPKYCCQNCMNAVNFFVEFRQKCTENEKTLQNAIEKTKPDVDSLHTHDEEIDSKQYVLKVEIDYNDKCKDDEEDFSYSFEVGNFNIKEEGQEEHIEPKPKTKKKHTKKINSKVLKLTNPDKSQKDKGNKKYKSHKKKKLDCDEGLKNTSFDCGICIKNNFEEDMLKKHLESHKGTRECELCGEALWSWPNLLGHRLKHLPKPQQKCHMCGRPYTSLPHLEYHYLTDHFTEYEKILKCPKCSRSYTTPRKYTKHQYGHRDSKYVCNECSKVVKTKQQMVTHMLAHSEQKTITCDLCPYVCKTSTSLRNHKMHLHNPNKKRCRQCSRYFLNQEKMDSHKCKGKMICPTCGICVNSNKHMAAHLRSHLEVGVYKCDRCPAVYRTASGLKTHINKHDGIRPYKCEYCPAKFYHYCVLVKHKRTHTGEKPYVCKVCGKSFTGNHNLKVHMRVHGQFLINKKNKMDDELGKDL